MGARVALVQGVHGDEKGLLDIGLVAQVPRHGGLEVGLPGRPVVGGRHLGARLGGSRRVSDHIGSDVAQLPVGLAREPDQKSEHYQWAGPWREEEPTEETLYLRRKAASCGSIEAGAKVVLIRASQCCDTGYFGEIGCHLKLRMVQDPPDDMKAAR